MCVSKKTIIAQLKFKLGAWSMAFKLVGDQCAGIRLVQVCMYIYISFVDLYLLMWQQKRRVNQLLANQIPEEEAFHMRDGRYTYIYTYIYIYI